MNKHKESFSRLVKIMNELREQCPWDQKQTLESLRYLTIEEVYEVITNINVWPRDFTKEMKIKFINGMIKHFEDREEYEKCARLYTIVQRLENSQSDIGRGRIEPN